MTGLASACDGGFRRGPLWRLAPSLSGLALYIVFTAIRQISLPAYEQLLQAIDTHQNLRPFNDTNAVLVAFKCWRQGVNVYSHNICMHGGNYNYSTFLLHAGALLRLGPDQTITVGLLAGALVLIVLAVLPLPASRRELGFRVAATCSGTMVYLFESVNIDSLLFIGTVCGVLALCRGGLARVFGYGVFALVAAVKFYPAILFTLLLREARRVFWGAVIIVLALAALYGLRFGDGIRAALAVLPVGPPCNYMFGAVDLAAGIAGLLGAPASPLIMPVTLALVVLALAAAWRDAAPYREAVFCIDEAKRLLLLAGALVIAECFFSAQNYDYRGVFFLLVFPGLFAMAGTSPALGERCIGFSMAVLFLMWEPLAKYIVLQLASALFGSGGVWLNIAYWLFREFIWWRVCIFLASLIFAFIGARLPSILSAREAA